MAFSGTLEKCNACHKTVYVVDLLSADGVNYHKSCFRCSHCNGHLVMSNYSSLDGVLYCKPHFEQLFKESGNFSKNFITAGKSGEKTNGQNKAPSRASSMFSGTQDKCATCNKTVYQMEKVTVEGESFHKSCFKCAPGGCSLTPSNYAALNGILYCKHHFAQLFKEKGSYNHLLTKTAIMRTGSMEVEAKPEPETETEPEPEQPQEQSA